MPAATRSSRLHVVVRPIQALVVADVGLLIGLFIFRRQLLDHPTQATLAEAEVEFTGRPVTTMTRRRPLAPPSEESEMTTDGWYIDIDPTIVCERLPRGSRTYLTSHVEGQPPEVPEFKDIGPRETGYPIDLTSDHASQRMLPDGTSQAFRMTLRQQVIHLSTDPIDPQLFEVPQNFLEKSRRR